MTNPIWRRPSLFIGILSAFGLLAAIACGSSPTPTATSVPPTATATPRPATPTPTTAPGTTATVVAQPTATATATPTPVPSVQPKRGGVIKQNAAEDPPSFDAHNATSAAHNIYNQKMYQTLVWNPNGSAIVPDAAESYSVSSDGKVWTFKLRPDIKYFTGYTPAFDRDGTTMTAKDVAYSLKKIMGLTDGVVSARSGWMKEFIDIDRPDNGMEVVDPLTLKIHLTQPFSGLITLLAIGYSGIMPEGVTQAMLARRPYGSGPFKVDLATSQRGALWKLKRNPDYFKQGLPYLDEWQFVLMDGTAIAQAAFLTHKTDVSGGYATPDNEAIYNKRIAAGEFYQLPYASDCRPGSVNMNTTKPPFSDKKLREAVNLAIDRNAYMQVVQNFGHGYPALYLTTGGWGKTAEEILKLPGWAQTRDTKDAEVAKAKQIVSELYPKGLDVKMMARNTSGYMIQNEFIAGELRKIGLNVTIEAQDTNLVFDRAVKLDYAIWSYWFCQTTNTPEELFGSYFVTGGSRNWIGYSNPNIDKGYREMAAMSDPAAKKKKAMEMEDLVLSSLTAVPLPDSLTTRTAYSYVKDLPMTITQYSREKNELAWRSDV